MEPAAVPSSVTALKKPLGAGNLTMSLALVYVTVLGPKDEILSGTLLVTFSADLQPLILP